MGSKAITCPVCAGGRAWVFFEARHLPGLIGVQWETAEGARRCRRGDLRLACCPDCTFIWNTAFEPATLDYTLPYDNSLHFSPTFQAYTDRLIGRLVEAYDLRGRKVIEIGCGHGDFLRALCRAGGAQGVGYDPSLAAAAERDAIAAEILEGSDGAETAGGAIAVASPVRLVAERFSARHGTREAALVCSRYVLEHIPRPVAFLCELTGAFRGERKGGHRKGTGAKRADGRPQPAFYFEVPNIDLILKDLSVWDIIYEHCSYFSRHSLARAFAAAGLRVQRLTAEYGDQFLAIDAVVDGLPGAARPEAPPAGRDDGQAELLRRVEAFPVRFAECLDGWRANLQRLARAGQRVVAWGAGAKAVSFFNLLEAEGASVPFVVDINPRKQGRYLPGTAQQIVGPGHLRQWRPDVIILMNPIYREEIRAQVAQLGLDPELLNA